MYRYDRVDDECIRVGPPGEISLARLIKMD